MKIIQISDTHINADPKSRIFGLVNTEDTLLDVLEIVRQEKPDFVLATGDLSQDGSKESYQRLKKYFNTLTCQVYAIYGNHDNQINFDENLIGGNVFKTHLLNTDVANFIFLNSRIEGKDSGFLSPIELSHLEKSLDTHTSCVPVIHHHFVPLESSVDKYILENRQELIDILQKYKNKIKFCITGHVHGFHESNIDGIKVYSCLSTCIQFAKTKNLQFENKRPGFTIYNFQGNDYEVIEKSL